ncbi:MAG: redoxin domain-containing protein [Bacteroidales bacterium]|nr:redoxin domain-containing protein [Bacteroidales bacterium]
MKIIYFVFVFIMTNIFAFSQDYNKYGVETAPKGLRVGAIAPTFEGVNQVGDNISLSELLKKGKVVVIFYRGYWCPYCSKYLKQYQDSLQLIVDKGASIVAITPEQEDGVNKTLDDTEAEFDIISDKENIIQKKYKVLFKVTNKYNAKIRTFLFADIAKNNGEEEAHLPVPATFIIGQDGKIEFVQFDVNYKKRATVKDILQNL